MRRCLDIVKELMDNITVTSLDSEKYEYEDGVKKKMFSLHSVVPESGKLL